MDTTIFTNVYGNWLDDKFKPAFDDALVTEYLVASSPFRTEAEWLLAIEQQIVNAIQHAPTNAYSPLFAAFKYVNSKLHQNISTHVALQPAHEPLGLLD